MLSEVRFADVSVVGNRTRLCHAFGCSTRHASRLDQNLKHWKHANLLINAIGKYRGVKKRYSLSRLMELNKSFVFRFKSTLWWLSEESFSRPNSRPCPSSCASAEVRTCGRPLDLVVRTGTEQNSRLVCHIGCNVYFPDTVINAVWN